ncbi:hypothetical protein IC235_00385 [Hymenobacter sp. BT664]|uniref:Uncharacterized protein n=1 Tax=Hymenobacter montanus TaxID=2771359 RepID=A0A927GHI2_9BACT|nr:hypothetical protein [Hymenobacter montanus]MBD2766345.1 hypothetical protein [Hymenobacter montanus]
MAERVRKGYKRLFEVRLLHHYWLDEGATSFDLLADPARRLLTYDCRPFLTLAPTPPTALALAGFGGLYRDTALGGLVLVPDEAVIPDDAIFELVLTVQQAAFYTYTALTLPARSIYELYHPAEGKSYRYKENVPVLSNLTGTARGAGPSQGLYLSREIPILTPTDRVEALVDIGNALHQLTSDQPGAATRQLAAALADTPVFVHQADVPELVPPAGLAGVPARGLLLTGGIPDAVFALLRIAAVRPGRADFSCTAAGRARASHPVFQVRFKNRSTNRHYFSRVTGAPVSTDPTPLPLTRFGNAGPKQKPTGDDIKFSFDQLAPGRITGLRSEIFE